MRERRGEGAGVRLGGAKREARATNVEALLQAFDFWVTKKRQLRLPEVPL